MSSIPETSENITLQESESSNEPAAAPPPPYKAVESPRPNPLNSPSNVRVEQPVQIDPAGLAQSVDNFNTPYTTSNPDSSIIIQVQLREDGEKSKEGTLGLEDPNAHVEIPGENGLVDFDQLPEWRHDNSFIKTHHRPTSYSYIKSIRSVFGLHNETVNIYSHLLGFLLFATFPAYIYTTVIPRYSNAKAGDIAVFALFFFGVSICFVLSAWFHTVANHSRDVATFWLKFDFIGITFLSWGSTVATIYYGFYCSNRLRWTYWTINGILSILCIFTTLIPVFQAPRFRHYRAILFSMLASSSLIFIIHGIAVYGWSLQFYRMSLAWMGLMGLLNVLGAAAYAARFPERWTNGMTDVWGNSHQWLHIFVIAAAVAHAVGLVAAFDFVHEPGLGGVCSPKEMLEQLNATVMGQFYNATNGISWLNDTSVANGTKLRF